jgi:hypothetical protein
LVLSAIRFSPILVFFKPGFLSFVCLEFSTSVVVVVVVASCLDLFQSVFVCSFWCCCKTRKVWSLNYFCLLSER